MLKYNRKTDVHNACRMVQIIHGSLFKLLRYWWTETLKDCKLGSRTIPDGNVFQIREVDGINDSQYIFKSPRSHPNCTKRCPCDSATVCSRVRLRIGCRSGFCMGGTHFPKRSGASPNRTFLTHVRPPTSLLCLRLCNLRSFDEIILSVRLWILSKRANSVLGACIHARGEYSIRLRIKALYATLFPNESRNGLSLRK